MTENQKFDRKIKCTHVNKKNGTEFLKIDQGLVCQKTDYFRPFSSQHPVQFGFDQKCDTNWP